MRYLVLSDIHANLEALDAVLAAAGPTDGVLMLGDVVGYGASPNEVITRLRALPLVAAVRGNHDKVALGLEPSDTFNRLARHAIEWTAATLASEHHVWLAALPRGPVAVTDAIEICHGAPFDEDFYTFDDIDAARALRAAGGAWCFYGHTHVPAAFRLHDGVTALTPPHGDVHRLTLDAGRYLVNCGAVGQPRDGDPRAAFGVLDVDARVIEVRRVAYDVATAQHRIREAGLPAQLAERLAHGH
jgi:diadenosine tetraphosphatase ApaH/serine/threonine PP2A family protein phosphatase